MKTNLKILGSDQQLCRGQKGGIEHVIHSLRAAFKNTDSEVIFAKNASNSLNRDLALRKTQKLCPSLDHSICNSYHEPSNLLIYKQTIFYRRYIPRRPPCNFVVWNCNYPLN